MKNKKKVCCPILQIFSNLNWINPDNITETDLKNALNKIGIKTYASNLFIGLFEHIKHSYPIISFNMLNKHKGIGGEIDASLSRDDYYLGNHINVSLNKIKQLKKFSIKVE